MREKKKLKTMLLQWHEQKIIVLIVLYMPVL